MKKYFGLSFIIFILICLTVYTVSAGKNEWETYDYSRFNNYNTYLYDIGGNFKNIDLNYYNGVLKDMKIKYGITYTFIIADDYTDSAWDLAACIREYAGYNKDYISVVVTTGGKAGERDYAVYTLGKGQRVMNDSYVEKMLDALYINLINEDYDGALNTFIDLSKKMTDDYMASSGVNVNQCLFWGLICGIVVALIFTMIELGKHKPVKKALNADFYVQDENVKITVVEDRYLRSHETRTKVSSSSSGGSGGSSRTGSSGRSGGGGSRRF